jgi:proteasome lid subunit RPN8/RPN11
VRGVLQLDRGAFDAICALAFQEYPLEMCGLIVGEPGSDSARRFVACRNVAESAKVYEIDPLEFMSVEDGADELGWQINGVVHSHTHSEPYPSPTDVAQAIDASWHYVIVGLKRDVPELRSYRIIDGDIVEEPVELV